MLIAPPEECGVFELFKSYTVPGANEATGRAIAIPLDPNWIRKVWIAAKATQLTHGYRVAVLKHEDVYVTIAWKGKSQPWEGRALLNESGWAFFETAQEAKEIMQWKIAHAADRSGTETARLRKIAKERVKQREEKDRISKEYQEKYLQGRIILEPDPIEIIETVKPLEPETVKISICQETHYVGLYDAEGLRIGERRYPCVFPVQENGQCKNHAWDFSVYGRTKPIYLMALTMPLDPTTCICPDATHVHVHVEEANGIIAIDADIAQAICDLCTIGAYTFESCQGGTDDAGDNMAAAYVAIYDKDELPELVIERMEEAGFPMQAAGYLGTGHDVVFRAYDHELHEDEAMRRNRLFRYTLSRAANAALQEWTIAAMRKGPAPIEFEYEEDYETEGVER